jgi:hypothetical protein
VNASHPRPRPRADESLAALDGHFFVLNGDSCRVNIFAIYEQGHSWLVLFAVDGMPFMRMVCVPPCGPARLLRAIAARLAMADVCELGGVWKKLAS